MRNIDISKEADRIVKFIKSTVDTAGFKDVVVGLSGGVDSSVATVLAVKALGKAHVYPFLLPYKNKNSAATKQAWLLIRQLNIPQAHVGQIDIAHEVNLFSKDLLRTSNFEPETTKLRLGNIMVRTRMIIIFDFAKKLPALVLGTENKSEHVLGYFTRYGDSASDIEPIIHLYKTEVFNLAKYLKIPPQIINQAPTAGLWPGQTDEGEFGFTYREADEVIYALFEAKTGENNLINQGINKAVIKKIKDRIASFDFKHRLPFYLR